VECLAFEIGFVFSNTRSAALRTQNEKIGFVFSRPKSQKYFIIIFQIRLCAILALSQIGFVFSDSFPQYASRKTQYEQIGFVFSTHSTRSCVNLLFHTFYGTSDQSLSFRPDGREVAGSGEIWYSKPIHV